MKFDDIWTRYRSDLKRFVRSKTANPADVDDLLQEISTKVFTGLPALQDPTKVKSWMFQIAQRTVVDFQRKSGRQHSRVAQADPLGEEGENPLNGLERCVLPMVVSLPAETQAALTAVYIDGQPQNVYAQERGLSYSALKARVQRGRTALLDLFEACCSLSFDRPGAVDNCIMKIDSCKKC